MKNDTLTINGKTLQLSTVHTLLQEGRRVEAIAYIAREADVGLKEARELVDTLAALMPGGRLDPASGCQSRSASFRKYNGRVKVSYTDPQGHTRTVTPGDPEWQEVKALLHHHEDLDAYEASYRGEKDTSAAASGGSVFLPPKSYRSWTRYLVPGILLLLLALYLYRRLA